MSLQIGNAFQVILDKNGTPLDNGYVFIGEAGQNPEAYPIQIFYDEDLTIPAPQPIKTINGYFSRNGSPARVFCGVSACSVTARDKNKILQWIDLGYTGVLNQEIQDAVKRGIANRYNPSITYNTGNIVLLDDGTEAISTIENNTNDPNSNLTGWIKKNLASQIFYDNGMSVQALSNLNVTPFNFGAKGDGITDDTQAIQDCVIFAIANKVSIMSPTAKFAYSSTILIPQLFDTTFTRNFIVSLNFGNSEFIALSDVTLFETGYYSGGNLVSSFGTPDMAHNSFGISLGGFTISSNVGYLSSEALRIQDWHQQSSIKNISSMVCQTILHSHNNFYCNFEYINGSYSDGKVGNRFIFSGSHNLNTFRKLIGVNSVIGYKFDGPLTAATFSEVSLEGMTIGAQFNSSVYELSVTGDYCENVTDVCYQFKDYSFLVNLGSGYVNFIDTPTMSFVEYAPLPGNGIVVSPTRAFQNIQPSNKIIKNTEDSYGYGIEINRVARQGSTIADTLPDTTYGAHVYLNQISKFIGYTAKVANQYVEGNYSGQFTSGYANQNGFSWNNLGNSTLSLSTKMRDSKTQRVYVSIECVVGGAGTLIQGEFIGGFPAKFYEFTPTGVSVTSKLVMTTVDGFLHIGSTLSGVIQSVSGEIRLV